MSQERSFAANVKAITELMAQAQMDYEALARKAVISTRTLERILQEGEKGYRATYQKIATAFEINDASTLYIHDEPHRGQTDPPNPTVIEIKLAEDPTTFDETIALARIIQGIRKAASTKHPTPIIAIILNSVTLTLLCDIEDLPQLLNAFIVGDLKPFKVSSIAIKQPLLPQHARPFVLDDSFPTSPVGTPSPSEISKIIRTGLPDI
jgi:hypothetical protein